MCASITQGVSGTFALLTHGVVLPHKVCGTGQPLVFIHGWGMDHSVWEPLLALLSPWYQCIALDLAGYGHQASADDLGRDISGHCADIEATLAALAVRSATLVGWSMGSQLAVVLAHRNPALVRSLVLVGATAQFVASCAYPHGLAVKQLHGMQAKLAISPHRTIAGFQGLLFSQAEQKHEQAWRRVVALLHQIPVPSRIVLQAGLEQLGCSSLFHLLPELRQPVLLLHGACDAICPLANAQAMAAVIPDVQMVIYDQAGHLPFLMQPKSVQHDIMTFLQRRVCV